MHFYLFCMNNHKNDLAVAEKMRTFFVQDHADLSKRAIVQAAKACSRPNKYILFSHCILVFVLSFALTMEKWRNLFIKQHFICK